MNTSEQVRIYRHFPFSIVRESYRQISFEKQIYTRFTKKTANDKDQEVVVIVLEASSFYVQNV